jgi:hypothetical protein
MIIIAFIYILVLIYVVICIFSTDLLFIGKKAKLLFTDEAGNKIYDRIENYHHLINCNPLHSCLNESNYYNINIENTRKRLNKKIKFN